MSAPLRNSDRWMTPGVVIALLLTGGGLVALTVAAVTYLTARGIDPAPVLDLPAKIGLAIGSLGTMVITLTARFSQAKVERTAGTLGPALEDHTAAIDQLASDVRDALSYGGHAAAQTGYARTMPPVPTNGTAPAVPGS